MNEGLTGLVARAGASGGGRAGEELIRGSKYFPEAGEDPYQSFLGVPLVDRGVLQGVLVVQTLEARSFPEDEIRLLAAGCNNRVAPVVSEGAHAGSAL